MAILLILIGLCGGVLGGMGMGGGTLTIPLLTALAGMDQHAAQAVNLIAFLPMSAIALFIHAKNGLLKPKKVWLLMICAAVSGVLGALLAQRLDAGFLRRAFGAFLSVLGVVSLGKEIVAFVRKRRGIGSQATQNR